MLLTVIGGGQRRDEALHGMEGWAVRRQPCDFGPLYGIWKRVRSSNRKHQCCHANTRCDCCGCLPSPAAFSSALTAYPDIFRAIYHIHGVGGQRSKIE